MKRNKHIHKAEFFIKEWLSSLLTNNAIDKKEIIFHEEEIKMLQEMWKKALPTVFEKKAAEILEKTTMPIDFFEETVFIKVAQADEKFLILNNQKKLLQALLNNQHAIKNQNIIKIKAVFSYIKI